jgi:hypothetical protein
MPYPNYHSARIKRPNKSASYATKVFKNGIHIILMNGNVQAIRFPKNKYTVSEAKEWLKEKGWFDRVLKFEKAMTNPIEPKLNIIDALEEALIIDTKAYIAKYITQSIHNMNTTDAIKAVYYDEIKDDVDTYIMRGFNNLLDQITERAEKHKTRGY